VFVGESDLMMPKEEGERLNKYLVNSKLVVKNGSHFNVFTKDDLKTVDIFLEN
jgi:hypothetical protein